MLLASASGSLLPWQICGFIAAVSVRRHACLVPRQDTSVPIYHSQYIKPAHHRKQKNKRKTCFRLLNTAEFESVEKL